MPKEIRFLELYIGISCNIPLCCINFYELAWLTSIRIQIPDYAKTMQRLNDRQGILLCPECVSKKLNKITLGS